MSTRDELYEWVDVTTYGDPKPQFIRGPLKASAYCMVMGTGMPADWQPPPDNHWDYVEDQPMRGYWDCLYCGSLYPNDVLKCSQCGAHKRKGQ